MAGGSQAFGGRLKGLRESAGLSRYELAKRSGVSATSLARIESGEREPTWPTAVRLARALGVGVGAFDPGGAAPADAARPGWEKWFGARVGVLRRRRGWSVEKFARFAGLPPGLVARIEGGEFGPDGVTCLGLVFELHIDGQSFLWGEDADAEENIPPVPLLAPIVTNGQLVTNEQLPAGSGPGVGSDQRATTAADRHR